MGRSDEVRIKQNDLLVFLHSLENDDDLFIEGGREAVQDDRAYTGQGHGDVGGEDQEA